MWNPALQALRDNVSGKVASGEAEAVIAIEEEDSLDPLYPTNHRARVMRIPDDGQDFPSLAECIKDHGRPHVGFCPKHHPEAYAVMSSTHYATNKASR